MGLGAGHIGRQQDAGARVNSNIGERGMALEENRAVVWQVDASNGATRTFATGLRNPTALAFEPASRQLWAVVNERDELGPDLVPDDLTSVREGAFYGWPYAYWGPNSDRRVQPRNDKKVRAAVPPDFALPSHSAPLGLSFVQPGFTAPFAEGAFIVADDLSNTVWRVTPAR